MYATGSFLKFRGWGEGGGVGGRGSLNWKPKACGLFTIRIFWSNGGVLAGSHKRECECMVKLMSLLMTAESMMQDKHQSIMHEFKSNYRRKLIKSGCPFGFRGLAVDDFLVKLIISFWDECQPAKFWLMLNVFWKPLAISSWILKITEFNCRYSVGYLWKFKWYLATSAMAWVAAADPDRQQNTLSVTGVSLSVTRLAM